MPPFHSSAVEDGLGVELQLRWAVRAQLELTEKMRNAMTALAAQTLIVSSALWLLSPNVLGEKHSTEKAPDPLKKSA